MSTDYTTLGLGAAVGLALGLGIGAVTSNPDMTQLQNRFAEQVDAAGEGTSEAIAAVTEKVDALAADVASMSESTSESISAGTAATGETLGAIEEQIADLAEKTDAIQADIAEAKEARAAIREAATSSGDAMSETLAGIRESISALESRLAAIETGAPAEPAPEAEAETAAAEPAAEPEPEGVTPGNVEMLADGALRVFVSAVDDADGTARVAINGIETQMLRVGRSARVDVDGQSCSVTLDGIDRGHVQLSGSCG